VRQLRHLEQQGGDRRRQGQGTQSSSSSSLAHSLMPAPAGALCCRPLMRATHHHPSPTCRRPLATRVRAHGSQCTPQARCTLGLPVFT
jgi:hypothetical protein